MVVLFQDWDSNNFRGLFQNLSYPMYLPRQYPIYNLHTYGGSRKTALCLLVLYAIIAKSLIIDPWSYFGGFVQIF